MTAAKKVLAKHNASQRITNTWHAHPVLTLSTIGALVAILSGSVPLLLSGLHYFAKHDELEAHKNSDARAIAWASVQAIKNEVLALRNRVNDCDIRREQARMSPLEKQACAQYAQEYDDASRRFSEARKTALEMSKEK